MKKSENLPPCRLQFCNSKPAPYVCVKSIHASGRKPPYSLFAAAIRNLDSVIARRRSSVEAIPCFTEEIASHPSTTPQRTRRRSGRLAMTDLELLVYGLPFDITVRFSSEGGCILRSVENCASLREGMRNFQPRLLYNPTPESNMTDTTPKMHVCKNCGLCPRGEICSRWWRGFCCVCSVSKGTPNF